jgi:hypothetical protein
LDEKDIKTIIIMHFSYNRLMNWFKNEKISSNF